MELIYEIGSYSPVAYIDDNGMAHIFSTPAPSLEVEEEYEDGWLENYIER